MTHTLSDLEDLWPRIKWREPIAITTPSGSGYDCRVCIANLGAAGSKPPRFPTLHEALTHMREVHGL